MYVVIAGMIKSGSTFSFNVAREILLASGKVSTSTADCFENWTDAKRFQHFITKTHVPSRQLTNGIRSGTIKCICTIRRPEDAIASFNRTFGHNLESLIEHVDSWLNWYSMVTPHVLTVHYESIDQATPFAIAKMDDFLNGGNNGDVMARIAEKYNKSALKEKLDGLGEDSNTVNIGFSFYERESFFHRRHISSLVSQSANDLVSEHDISRIRSALSRYVDASGHLRPMSGSNSADLNGAIPTVKYF
jgi:hypothetical protein